MDCFLKKKLSFSDQKEEKEKQPACPPRQRSDWGKGGGRKSSFRGEKTFLSLRRPSVWLIWGTATKAEKVFSKKGDLPRQEGEIGNQAGKMLKKTTKSSPSPTPSERSFCCEGKEPPEDPRPKNFRSRLLRSKKELSSKIKREGLKRESQPLTS